MLDTKKAGIKIASLRKKSGYTQEMLAEILRISPQAISKWENGHTLPETSLLPILSQIFDCTIDQIIMPAYSFDVKIEEIKSTISEKQAEHIAEYLFKKMGEANMNKTNIGLDDNTIINSMYKAHGNIGNCIIRRENAIKTDRSVNTSITVTGPQKEYKLIEKILFGDDCELHRFALFNKMEVSVPRVYYIDFDKKAILSEDLSQSYIQGFDYDEDNDSGQIIRENYNTILSAAADLHALFWDNYDVFGQVGLPWRLSTNENFLSHMNGMEKDYKKYKKNYESKTEKRYFECYEYALKKLREEYAKLFETRFHAGRNITVIHGDLHPGNIFLSKSDDRAVKFIDLEAVRMGLCTEDLAMLIALHIEPDKKIAMPLLDHYYRHLCNSINDYDYETFLNDYKISIMENLFFPVRLINRGILDFNMRDKSIKAFETFVTA
jgi:transcriptional regulator with XRE-family HTH domain/aminoglycoside phosphotransferase (APT) family kinase protein